MFRPPMPPMPTRGYMPFFQQQMSPTMFPSQLPMGQMQGLSRGGGLLSRLFSGGAGRNAMMLNGMRGFSGFPGAQQGMQGLSGMQGGLSSLQGLTQGAGGFTGVLDNLQKGLKMAQTVGPMVQQYGPMIRNIPSMIKLYQELSNMDDADSSNTENETTETVVEESNESSIEQETTKESRPYLLSPPTDDEFEESADDFEDIDENTLDLTTIGESHIEQEESLKPKVSQPKLYI
ncbi:YqfQ family protein [Bacillus tianshenii]|nr:YqfQ family protein [Bacillus tianshenii]